MNDEREIRGIIRMLDSLAKTAEEASLTGALSEGRDMAIKQYNAILKRLSEMGEIPEGLFSELDEGISFDDVGIACKQLISYLEGTMETRERKEGEEKVVAEGDNIGDNVLIIGGDIFRELGEWLRSGLLKDVKEALSDVFKMKVEETEEEGREEKDLTLDELESRIAELGGQMQVLAEKLRREELSPDEVRRLADEMRKIGFKQAELARKRAELRAKMNQEQKAGQSNSNFHP
ncbi:TPA: hypothetical protein EYP37_01190 [Candidatus Poribacteria bacterium]|nr:hypothetical protein [Candidatus Poribacteria bacterium]